MIKDFNNTIELLTWRRYSLLEMIDILPTSNRMRREYVVRVKEIDWLISKLNQKLEKV